MTTAEPRESLDFIRTIIEDDRASDKHGAAVVTPPTTLSSVAVGPSVTSRSVTAF